ncbi:MAG: hypothetical protein N5848_08620 [Lactobacillus crispatus]|nr:hypothetical protein [Lactobacillus crispatus]MCT7709432.1 hypothetical protein [Lactobacillus crispatus]
MTTADKQTTDSATKALISVEPNAKVYSVRHDAKSNQNVIYYNKQSTVTINYYDDTDKKLINSEKITGLAGQPTDNKNAPSDLYTEVYSDNSDNNIPSVFPNQDKSVTLHYTHKTMTGDDGKLVLRQVNYIDPVTHQVKQIATQETNIIREKTLDEVTGKSTYTPYDSSYFAQITPPEIAGYRVVNPNAAAKQTVDENTADQTVTFTYVPDSSQTVNKDAIIEKTPIRPVLAPPPTRPYSKPIVVKFESDPITFCAIETNDGNIIAKDLNEEQATQKLKNATSQKSDDNTDAKSDSQKQNTQTKDSATTTDQTNKDNQGNSSSQNSGASITINDNSASSASSTTTDPKKTNSDTNNNSVDQNNTKTNTQVNDSKQSPSNLVNAVNNSSSAKTTDSKKSNNTNAVLTNVKANNKQVSSNNKTEKPLSDPKELVTAHRNKATDQKKENISSRDASTGSDSNSTVKSAATGSNSSAQNVLPQTNNSSDPVIVTAASMATLGSLLSSYLLLKKNKKA